MVAPRVLLLFFFAAATSAGTYSGDGTYYAATGGGACSFEPTSAQPLLVAAMNDPQYSSPPAQVCGSCAHVTGPDGQVTVRIVDLCPECLTGSLDLSPDAFAYLSPLSAGRIAISWDFVPCEVFGNIQFHIKDGANVWWLAVRVDNSRVTVTKVEFKVAGSTQWQYTNRTSYNYFLRTFSGSGATPPVSIRITGITGEVLIATNVLTDVTENKTYPSTIQFAAPQTASSSSSSSPSSGGHTASLSSSSSSSSSSSGNAASLSSSSALSASSSSGGYTESLSSSSYSEKTAYSSSSSSSIGNAAPLSSSSAGSTSSHKSSDQQALAVIASSSLTLFLFATTLGGFLL
jgi:expansin (peptidoglycan-binding protein)